MKRKKSKTRVIDRVAGGHGNHVVVLSTELERQIVSAVTGLLRVARIAMPDTFFATDSRVRRAQRLMVSFGRKPVR